MKALVFLPAASLASPVSGPAELARRRAGLNATHRNASAPGLADPLAPSIGLPLRFVLTGILCLLAGVAGIIVRPDLLATYHYNQYAVAVTHLFVLGFMASIVMGAMYQLVPVALETRLQSERLGRWHFLCHLVGFVGMVAMFWLWNLKQVGHFGSVFALGVGLFVYNLARTLGRVPRWNVVASGIASALFWLVAGVLAGLVIAAAKCAYDSPTVPGGPIVAWLVARLEAVAGYLGRFDALALMHAHAHLGVVGFFLMMVVAVSYKLLPMFALSEPQNTRRALWSVGLLNAGLAALFFTLTLRSAWKLAGAALVAAGLVAYGLEIRAIVRARKRRALDWGLKYFLTALTLLAPVAALGILLAWPGLPATALTTQLESVYGFLGLMGVIGFSIVGMLHKIIPFLVWYRAYSPHLGRWKVPSFGDLYRERLQVAGYWFYLAGLVVTSVGTALGEAAGVRAGCSLLAASLVAFAVNVGYMLSHLVHPRLEPLPGFRIPERQP